MLAIPRLFIVEEGEWKIWHLHVYGIFLAPFGRSWVEQPEDMADPPPMLEEHRPDRPPTTHWQYRPDRVYVNEPAPPGSVRDVRSRGALLMRGYRTDVHR
ncbi:MAG TPA: hypothetical protein VN969_32295 [Streptosporangiaceae bacterium]|nr:hypothetical protein [Streptosporangiaceae bacterium]